VPSVHDVVVVGGGLAGLATAYAAERAGHSAVVLEADAEPGGLARSVRERGYTFDYSGHLLHLRSPVTQAMVADVTPADAWAKVRRSSAVLVGDALVPYPFQSHLAFAPDDVRDECVAALPETAPSFGDPESVSLGEWSRAALGKGIAKHFMEPYNEKISTVSADELVSSALGRFLPTPSLDEIREGAASRRLLSTGYNAEFLYPARGGIDLLAHGLAAHVGDVRTGCRVVGVDARARTVTTENGDAFAYERLVTTAPLPATCRMLADGDDLVARARDLRANSVLCVNLGVRNPTERYRGLQWVYLPEREYRAYRVGFYSGLVDTMAPAGAAALYVEIAFRGEVSHDDLVRDAIADVVRMGAIASAGDVEVVRPVHIPIAYVIHDRAHGPVTRDLLAALAERGVTSIGRYGRWEYSSMEDAMLQGVAAGTG
jgi:protoporphyrinogen oxidase